MCANLQGPSKYVKEGPLSPKLDTFAISLTFPKIKLHYISRAL